jgi:cytosine/adenosine deaminase-related metal-dependent hydrolase
VAETFCADWVLPVAARPIRRGFVTVADGRVVAVGEGTPGSAVRLGRAAILPALVNAHCHLELSHLHGRVAAGRGFDRWVRELMAVRREDRDAAGPRILDAARRAIAAAHACGTGLIGDVSNTLITVPLLREARVAAHVFHELVGFNVADPGAHVRRAREQIEAASAEDGDVRVSLAPHAPYSVSPALFRAIRADLDRHPASITSVHAAESPEEVELVASGTGPFRSMLEGLGVWTDGWPVPGVSPVQYLAGLGFLGPGVLVVHGVQCDDGDLGRARAAGATLVSCPRSNRYVGVGAPPLAAAYAAGLPVAFGTDSLASVGDLNLFAEIAEARRLAPGVAAGRLIESATRVGARALGFEGEFGRLAPGARAALLSVRVPEGVTDVEEYLVSGVEREMIEWI